jgi:hypothetical protein
MNAGTTLSLEPEERQAAFQAAGVDQTGTIAAAAASLLWFWLRLNAHSTRHASAAEDVMARQRYPGGLPGLIGLVAVAIFAMTLGCRPALAWGASGHRMISRLAIESLPAEIPDFLRAPDVAEAMGELGREPDRLRAGGTVFDADNSPGHYIDLEDNGAVLGGVPFDPLPGVRQVFDSALRAKGQDQYAAGYLPYSIIEGWQQLRQDFAYWRVLVVAEKSAMPAADREWFAKDRRRREMLIVRDLGQWSHFVADGSQPLHATVHFNGWGNYPNPQGYSTSNEIHAYFEGKFVRSFIVADDVSPKIGPYADCRCAIEQRTVRYLLATNRQVIRLYELDKAKAFDGVDATGKDFVATRLAAAVAELRDLIIDAWRSSHDGKVGYPAIDVRAVEDNKVQDFEPLKGLD